MKRISSWNTVVKILQSIYPLPKPWRIIHCIQRRTIQIVLHNGMHTEFIMMIIWQLIEAVSYRIGYYIYETISMRIKRLLVMSHWLCQY